ncbi:MAG: alpha-galactosidase [Clostridia bacterium]
MSSSGTPAADVAIIGAGSMQFTQQVVSDLMRDPVTRHVHFRLMDLDPERLALAVRLVQRIQEETGGRGGAEGSPDLKSALSGVDFAINEIQVGGLAATELDFAIPGRYGIRQTIGDTLGIGGISRSLRTIPAVLHIASVLQAQAPHAWFLNYTNPMAAVMRAVSWTHPDLVAVGLCHSAEYTARALARYLDLEFDELDWLSAGINHQAWLLRLQHRGRDLYPLLHEKAQDPAIFERDPVRFELLRRFGRFVTESSEHNAEYVPYFLPWDDEIERLQVPVDEYLRRSRNSVAKFAALSRQVEVPGSLLVDPSPEYAPRIIRSALSGEPLVFYANVPNDGAISNLPADALVEVPAVVDRHAIHATRVGSLPEGPRALNQQSINVQMLTVQAVLREDRELLLQAAYIDPMLQSRLRLREIEALVDDLLIAHRQWLPTGWFGP